MLYLRSKKIVEGVDIMYFDPGTGSMLVQVIIATMAGVGAFFVTFKTNFLTFVKGIFKKNDKNKK